MNNSKTGWIVAGALGVVIGVLLTLMWSAWDRDQRDLDNVLENGQENISEARDAIAEKCEGPNADADDCNDALDELKAILMEFNKDVNNASTSASGSVQY